MKVKELREKLQFYSDEDEVRFESARYPEDISQSRRWSDQSNIERFDLLGGLIIYYVPDGVNKEAYYAIQSCK
jgi:hypothetical protein